MIKFLADENLNGHIVSGVRRRVPGVDILRVQNIGLISTGDGKILEYASSDGRVVLSHDVTTMVAFAHSRISAGMPFAGLVIIKAKAGLGQAIADLSLLCLRSSDDELQGQVVYLPFS